MAMTVEHPLVFAVGILGNVLSFLVILSPVTPLTTHRRYLLHSATASAAATTKGMIEGTNTPTDRGGFEGATDDVREHAFTNNNGGSIATMHGRYLLSHGNGAAPKGIVEGAVFPSLEIHGDKGSMVDVDDVRPTNPGHSPGGHALANKNEHSSCTHDPNSNGVKCTPSPGNRP